MKSDRKEDIVVDNSTWERLREIKKKDTLLHNLSGLKSQLKMPGGTETLFDIKAKIGYIDGRIDKHTLATVVYEDNLMMEALGLVQENGEKLTIESILQSESGSSTDKEIVYSSNKSEVKMIVELEKGGNYPKYKWVLEDQTLEDKQEVLDALSNCYAARLTQELVKDINEGKFKAGYEKQIEVADEDRLSFEYFLAKNGFAMNVAGLKYDEGKFTLDINKLDGTADTEQFLASQTAKDILSSLDACGLELSERMIGSMCETQGFHERRGGNGYADMTRQFGYLFAEKHNEDRVSEIFANVTEEKMDQLVNLLMTKEMSVSAKLWLKMAINMVYFDVPIGGVDRYKKYKYYKSGLAFKGSGACEDGEDYMMVRKSEKREMDDDFIYFYNRDNQKDVKDGYFMAMNRKSIVVNNVILPAGFFCRVSPRGEVEPVRLSMFGVPVNELKDAFGYQYKKAVENKTDLTSYNVGEIISH